MMKRTQFKIVAATAVLLASALAAAAQNVQSVDPNEPPAASQGQPAPGSEAAPADPKAAPPADAPGAGAAPGLRERYRSARKGYQGDPGLMGLTFPRNPKEANEVVSKLLTELGKMEDPLLAEKVMAAIERIWRMPGGDTVNLLIDRASDAANKNNTDLAIKLLDAAVDLAPDYSEAWSRRAFVFYLKGDTERALGDLRRTLALEPNHFKALEGLSRMLQEQGQKKGALKALEQLYKLNPNTPGAKTAIDNLKKEVEGQGI
jgi:tetratricopeptide (TPR) repeat protein